MQDASTLEDGLTATYTRALQADCFKHYLPRQQPFAPPTFADDYAKCNSVFGEHRAEAFKAFHEKHKGYLEARDLWQAERKSDQHFLQLMREHFEKIGQTANATKCYLALQDHAGSEI